MGDPDGDGHADADGDASDGTAGADDTADARDAEAGPDDDDGTIAGFETRTLDDGPPADDDSSGQSRLLTIIGVIVVTLTVVESGVLLFAAAQGSGDGGPTAPDATWHAERINDTHVRIRHAGGEPVDADDLVISVAGYRRNASWSGMVDRGEAAVVRAPPNQVIRLYWTPPQGQGPRDLLGSWRVG
ncbi:MAG: type IV pilin N-terminal domain-containing protein [Halobacteriaceae archaeon]